MKKTFFLGFTLLFISLVSFSQSVLNVGATQTYTTINAAINAASSGDTINIVDDIHLEHGITVYKSVIIRGQGSESTTIDGGNMDRVFYVPASDVFIFDLTIQNGQGQEGTSEIGYPGGAGGDGGAIYNEGTLTIKRCVLQNNRTGNGGNGSDGFPGSPGFQSGGAIPGSEDGVPGSPGFDGGRSGNGGAIHNAGTATLVIENTSFYQNMTQNGGNGGLGGDGGAGADGDPDGAGDNGGNGADGADGGIGGNGGSGGAIFNLGYLIITNSSFVENSIMFPGNGGNGGIGGQGGIGMPINNTDANGGAGGAGGNGGLTGFPGSGGAIADSATAIIINCTFYQNVAGMTDMTTAGAGGNGGMGGDGATSSPPAPNGSGIGGVGGDAGNGANACNGSSGGGIYAAFGTQIINTIVSDNEIFPANMMNYGVQGIPGPSGMNWDYSQVTPPEGNSGTDGSAGTNVMGIECYGNFISHGTNIVYNFDPGSMGWDGSDILSSDPEMLTYQDNGGYTPTVGINSSSIAYDAGTDSHGTLTIPSEDQRGFNRQLPTDIGAFEFRIMPNIVINEVDADQTATDSDEFIELFSPDGQVDLDEMMVLLYNGSDDLTYDAIDLEGYQTNTAGYFVIGSSTVPNVDLVEFTTNGIQNGADAVALCRGIDYNFPAGSSVPDEDSIVDALVYDTDDADDAGLLPLINTGQAQINEDGNNNKDTESNQRLPNGSGGNRNTSTYTQILPTPGTENLVPAPVADFTGTPLTICEGENVTFTDASTNTPTGWDWDFGDGNTSLIQNPTNIFVNPGTYTVILTATNAGGSDTETKIDYITVQATPDAGTDGTLTVCEGTTPTEAELFAELGGTPDTGGAWTNSGLVYTYTVSATSPCTGSVTAAVTVTEQTAPDAGTDGTLTVCEGTTPTEAELFAELGGTPDTGGTWTNSGLVYTYTVNAIAPCTNDATATITVTEDPILILSTSSTNATCGDSDGTATVVATGGTGIYFYLWDDPSTQDTPTATGLAQGTYNVEVTSGACVATDIANVNEDGAPTVTVSATETEICEGETTVLTASGADIYTWSPATGLDATTGAIVNATPVSDITYTVTGTTAGCSASENISITVNHTPTVGFTIDASNEPVIDFINTTTNADSYSWDLGDGTTETTTDVTHEYTANNIYTVILSATNGCGTETYQQDVTIIGVGIASIDKASIEVYPNPVKDILYIQGEGLSNLKIYAIDGRLLMNKGEIHNGFMINTDQFESGLYIITVWQDGLRKSIPFVKE
ncbi:MAG: PKD domain-containing protein [Bacteroidota bacterium]|nr:PKD domain-containing protein [Bacteroidota bacterium]